MKRNDNANKFVHDVSHTATSTTQINLLEVVKDASHFEKDIQRKMLQFEKQGISGSTCTEYFDNMIDKYIAKLLSQLEKAHNDNANIIWQYLHSRACEKTRLEKLLERVEAEVNTTTLEYNALKLLVDKTDPLKSTMLQAENTEKEA